MAYKEITEVNLTEGFHTIFIYVNDITNGLFIKLLLFTIYAIVCFGLYFTQKKATGQGDFPMAMAVSGFVIAVLTVLLRLISGLIDGWTIAIVMIVALGSIIWFFFSKD